MSDGSTLRLASGNLLLEKPRRTDRCNSDNLLGSDFIAGAELRAWDGVEHMSRDEIDRSNDMRLNQIYSLPLAAVGTGILATSASGLNPKKAAEKVKTVVALAVTLFDLLSKLFDDLFGTESQKSSKPSPDREPPRTPNLP